MPGAKEEVEKILHERDESYGEVWLVSSEMLGHMLRIGGHLPLFRSPMLSLWLGVWKKLMRLLVNPTHRDSWLDVAGYAVKAADHLGQHDVGQDMPTEVRLRHENPYPKSERRF